ncbi:MAG: hypothetical protein LC798_07970 [Chloroflexi bacterium]|nr:hypothetical protein [Chloroflexota bacterium]
MKLRPRALAAVAALLLTLALGAGQAQADSPAQTYTSEFAFSLNSPCAPYELINVTGTLRGVVHEHGGHYTSHEILTWKGESVSGVKYVGRSVENTSFQGLFGQGTAATQTDEQTVTYIAQGESAKGDDFLAHHVIHVTYNHHVIHVTYNPDGEVTALVFNEHTECK